MIGQWEQRFAAERSRPSLVHLTLQGHPDFVPAPFRVPSRTSAHTVRRLRSSVSVLRGHVKAASFAVVSAVAIGALAAMPGQSSSTGNTTNYDRVIEVNSETLRSSLIGRKIMIRAKAVVMAALIGTVGITEARAECEIADAKLEEAIQQNPKLRGPANSQSVRDLRSLCRIHAPILWAS